MELLNVQIASLMLIGLALVLIGIWSARHGGARVAMLTLFTALLVQVYSSSASLLGRAKPMQLEWLQPQIAEVTILNGYLIEQEGIFLTLVWSDVPPRLYVMPWDENTAQQLQQAMQDAEQSGTEVKMRMPFEQQKAEQQEPVFYALPQQKLPDKPKPEQGIRLG